jgi:hypothetical protein
MAFFAVPAARALAMHRNDYMAPLAIVFALVIGGIPTLIGALVLRLGLKRLAVRPPPSVPPPG